MVWCWSIPNQNAGELVHWWNGCSMKNVETYIVQTLFASLWISCLWKRILWFFKCKDFHSSVVVTVSDSISWIWPLLWWEIKGFLGIQLAFNAGWNWLAGIAVCWAGGWHCQMIMTLSCEHTTCLQALRGDLADIPHMVQNSLDSNTLWSACQG